MFFRQFFPLLILAVLVAGGFVLSRSAEFGREPAFAWIAGAVFGLVLQRSRFCFFCNFRDFVERREADGVLAILLALAVGLAGCHVITGAWIVDPSAGHLPPKAHIAPVGWNLVFGGMLFGLGMALSGSCISAHLYRLGEGSMVCLFALAGLVPGFLLGFVFWNPVYLSTVSGAPVVWLPRHLGFFGALAVQWGLLGGLAFLAWRFSASGDAVRPPSGERNLSAIGRAVFVRRWPVWAGGVVIGALSAAVLLRTEPLGVTSEFSRLARWAGDLLGVLPERLEGLDAIRGCSSRPAACLLSRGVLFVLALVLASLASAVAAAEFSWEWPRRSAAFAAFCGGILLGIGAAWSFGCTVGTLLSGIHASALSGWIFGLALILGILAGLRLRSAARRLRA